MAVLDWLLPGRSVSLKTFRAKLCARPFYQIARGRLDILQSIMQAELLSIVSAHLMERKHLDSFHIAEPAGK